MSDKAKKIFFTLTIVVPFLLYCVYYYSHMIKNAPYKFSEFKSFVFKYGTSDSMVNTYNSATGDYQYLNRKDSLVKTNLPLHSSDLLYLHRKAAELGFWDFPVQELGDSSKIKGKPLRYYIEFNYQRKSKKVWFDESFDRDLKLKDANKTFINEIQRVLGEAEEKNKK
jgi:hypothetical protein